MLKRILVAISALLMVVALYMIFLYAPIAAGADGQPDIVQKIFYFHVPVDWVAFLSFFLVFLGSILYLLRRDLKWDYFAVSAAEVGIIFTTLMLVTGSIWGKAEWGVWWTWDARLTSALVLWLILIAYFIIRSYVSEDLRRARFAAVLGIVGFLDVPVVALAITISRTTHPPPVIFEGGLDPRMLATFLISLFSFTFFFIILFNWRLSLKKIEEEVKKLKISLRR